MEITLAQKAEKFAADKHKGLYGTKPYTHHLKIVIDELLEVIHLIPKQHQDAVIAAAWLHDIMEDEKINNAVLEDEFGKQVAELVWLLTNHTGKRASPEYYEKLKINPFATIIKLCDRIANVKYSLAGKEKLHPNESDVTKQNEQMRCEHKFAMYKSENDVFVSELNNTEFWDIYFKMANDVGFNLDKAISKLSLKLFHLFNQPQLRAEKEAEMNSGIRKVTFSVIMNNGQIGLEYDSVPEKSVNTLEILGILEIVKKHFIEKQN
jgi:(p)ppGpp synthase/HD superfamily hydrolase